MGEENDDAWVDWLIGVNYPFDFFTDDLPPVDPKRLALRWKELDGWYDVTDEDAIDLVREEMGVVDES
jgi:hypothetical protein